MRAVQLSKREAQAICGSLSRTSKMPGHSYSLPAEECRIGSFLQQVPKSVCGHCYALRGRYVFPVVRNAMQKRLASISDPRWVVAITSLIHRSGEKYFRWHDSGDLQGIQHLKNIIAVCRNLPAVKFWLPTREYQMVEAYRRIGGTIPTNLCIRYSAHLVNGRAPLGYGMPASSVSSDRIKMPPGAYHCAAADSGKSCGPCRACWDPRISVIDFPLKWRSQQSSQTRLPKVLS